MAIVEMKKVFIIGMERDQEDILRYIQRFGRVEIADIHPETDPLGEETVASDAHTGLERIQQQVDNVGAAISFLTPYAEKKGGFLAPRPVKTLEEMRRLAEEPGELADIVDTVEGYTETLGELRTKRLQYTNLLEQIFPWEGMDAPFDDIKATAHTQVAVGFISQENWEGLDRESIPDLLHMEKVGSDQDNVCVFAAYFTDSDAEEWLKDVGFSRTAFSGLEKTAAEHIARYREELKGLVNREESIQHQAKELAAHMEGLKGLYDALSMELSKAQSVRRMRRTDTTFLLRGWIPAQLTEDFTGGLETAATDIYVWYEEPAPGEDFPVLIDNPAVVRPFEFVTDLYSTPSSHGIDPNKIMAPFFFIFFGMMLSDGGYGAVLALLGGLALWKLRLKGGMARMAALMALGGVSTLIWGALYGGWFGEWNFGGRVGPVWFNPMDDPIKTLIVCFAFGFIHIFVGMGVKAYQNIKAGRVLDALFDQGFWYIFLAGLVMLALPATATAGKFMAIGGALGLILTQGRKQEGVVKKLLSGVMSLYDTTGFLSDILSYSRLFALGLATGVIASVINQLAAMLGGTWYGVIMQVLILIGGHIFNILINVLGAFVHASRLQYIEFFGKFFEGGGKSFSPLSIKTKYVEVTDKKEAHAL